MTNIVSPCVNICQLDARGETCLGCGRTRDEIGGWMSMSAEERDAVMARLADSQPEPAP
ncbi:MAG: hypothetical protein JWN07_1479 [Hyphomicrobiales bacterium]|nr:hypothetical protein [Hyphomicrobiales bacterium]